MIDGMARMNHDAGTQHFQKRIDDQKIADKQGDAEQGRFVAAADDAIVDLQHVERASEGEKIDEEAESHRGGECRNTRLQAGAQNSIDFRGTEHTHRFTCTQGTRSAFSIR